MGGFLEVLLPRLFPDLSFQCVPHEGKQDLEKSIPRKLKAWHEPGVLFCVIRDNDSGDCRVLKEKLVVLFKSGAETIRWSVSLARSWRPGIWESQTLWRRLSATIICGGSEIKRDIVTRTPSSNHLPKSEGSYPNSKSFRVLAALPGI